MLLAGVTPSSCTSYISSVGNLIDLVEKIDEDADPWFHTATTLREEAQRIGVNLEEPKHPADLTREGFASVVPAEAKEAANRLLEGVVR